MGFSLRMGVEKILEIFPTTRFPGQMPAVEARIQVGSVMF
jgi:hypothetical protein